MTLIAEMAVRKSVEILSQGLVERYDARRGAPRKRGGAPRS